MQKTPPHKDHLKIKTMMLNLYNTAYSLFNHMIIIKKTNLQYELSPLN